MIASLTSYLIHRANDALFGHCQPKVLKKPEKCSTYYVEHLVHKDLFYFFFCST